MKVYQHKCPISNCKRKASMKGAFCKSHWDRIPSNVKESLDASLGWGLHTDDWLIDVWMGKTWVEVEDQYLEMSATGDPSA